MPQEYKMEYVIGQCIGIKAMQPHYFTGCAIITKQKILQNFAEFIIVNGGRIKQSGS